MRIAPTGAAVSLYRFVRLYSAGPIVEPPAVLVGPEGEVGVRLQFDSGVHGPILVLERLAANRHQIALSVPRELSLPILPA